MANTFKNYASAAVGTTQTTILTATANTTVIGCSIANIIGANINTSIILNTGGSDYYLLKDALVPVGGALVPIGGDQKLVLEIGDSIKVINSAVASTDVILSVLEIS